jgi:putative ABC transport system substrate-binding protein
VPVNVTFLEELRRYGFIEGQNLAVEWRAFGAHPDLISQYASELVEARVDAIVAGAGEAVRALQGATKTIPIIGLVSDMIWEGFVSSLARPNGNMTGVNVLSVELDSKRQEILIEAVPGLRQVAILADANYTKGTNVDALREVARAHDVELSIYRVATGDEIATAINNAQASGCTALNVMAGPLFWANRQLIMDHATAMRLPAIYEFAEMAEEGGFAAYGPRLNDLFVKVIARQLFHILRGTKVADIPVEQPTKFELVIDLRNATAMGLKVPTSMLLIADKVIEWNPCCCIVWSVSGPLLTYVVNAEMSGFGGKSGLTPAGSARSPFDPKLTSSCESIRTSALAFSQPQRSLLFHRLNSSGCTGDANDDPAR